MADLDPKLAAAHALLAEARSLRREPRDLRPLAEWTVLVAGLRSVGKSSLVCTLWGDPELLPTAVRDCTQTNTLVRAPAANEADRAIWVEHLAREQALNFALRDLSCVRLDEKLRQAEGPMGPRLDDLPPEPRMRETMAGIRRLFQVRPDEAVLNDHLNDELDKLDQFLAFLDSPAFRPGARVETGWDRRRLHLMGNLQPDGRRLDVGQLLAYRHVELVRATDRFGATPPRLIDTPWIPAFHNARRADLILDRAREADVLMLVALPGKFELEPWLETLLKERPELAARAVVVFNQIDTLDTSALFSREGFAQEFVEIGERLARQGFEPASFHFCCARLPFLETGAKDAFLKERVAKLQAILKSLAKLADDRARGPFKAKLLEACDPRGEAGLAALRAELLKQGDAARRARAREALNELAWLTDEDFTGPAERTGELRRQARELAEALKPERNAPGGVRSPWDE
ncbi:MAG: hypothetical protein M5U26_22150 [Planctomycetota bacterium]|nr:hypothetical protein [Planctomycetota bacterium]